MNRLQQLQKIAESKHKQLLIEEFTPLLSVNNIIELKQSKIIESKEGTSFESRIVLKDVPITRYTENANGRIYPKQLWENVVKQNCFDGSYCFADHKDEPSVMDIVGVWNNLRILDEYAIADISLIGNGKRMKEIIENGGKVGFSTVGYGEISESDNKTVNPETYEYLSTDWVVSPSQNVYATAENIKENKNIYNNFTNKYNHSETENLLKTIDEVIMDKYIEATLRNQVRSVLKEVQKNSDTMSSIQELNEMLKSIPQEMVDVRSQVETTIQQLQEKLHNKTQLTEQEMSKLQEELSQKEKEIKELQAKLEKANKVVGHVKVYKENIRLMAKDIKQFIKDRMLMEKDIKIFIEEIKKRDEDIACFIKERVQLKESLNALSKAKRKLHKNVNNLNKQLYEAKRYIRKLKDLLEDNDIEDELLYDDPLDTIDTVDMINEPVDDIDTITDIDTVDDVDDMADIELANDEEFIVEAEEKSDKKDDEDEEEDEKEDKDEDEDEEDDNEKEDDEDEEDKKEKKESRKNKIVRNFYKETVRKKPYIKAIKHSILTANSLYEAINKVKTYETKLKESKKAVFKIKENSDKPFNGKFEKYIFNPDEE